MSSKFFVERGSIMAKAPDKSSIKPPRTFLTLLHEKHEGAKRYSDEIHAVGPPRSIFSPNPNVRRDLITLPAMRGFLRLTDEQIVDFHPSHPIYEILLRPFRVKQICRLGETAAYKRTERRVLKERKAERKAEQQAERERTEAKGFMAWIEKKD
jgi:hypothetical protein